MARRVVSVVAVLLAITGVLGAVRVQQDPSAQQRLSDARAFVRAHRSANVNGTLRIGGVTKEVQGAIAGARRTRVVVTSSEGVREELLAAGEAVYTRYATSEAALPAAKYRPLNASTIADYHVREVDVAALLAAANHPRSRGVAVETDVDTRALLGRQPRSIKWMTLSLTLGVAGEVTRVLVVSRTASGTDRTNVRFDDWGTPVRIAAPRPDQLDPTPGIEEEKLAAWKDAPLYMPKRPPAGWRLTRADVLAKEVTAEGCAEVEFDYEDPHSPDDDYLYLYEFPRGCADELNTPDMTPFRAGSYVGVGQQSVDGSTLVQITVGTTTVQGDSSLSLDGLARVLKDLTPFVLPPPHA